MENERTVLFGYVDEEKVTETLSTRYADDNFEASSIADGVPRFHSVDDFTTFRAEYALQDGNVIIHFFPPVDGPLSKSDDYWERVFAIHLDSVAREHFQADRPRLVAKYTEEMRSWWLRALSYDHIIDLSGFLDKFFSALDSSLDGLPQR